MTYSDHTTNIEGIYRLKTSLSWSYLKSGDFKEGLRRAKEATEIVKDHNHTQYMTSICHLAELYEGMGQLEESMTCYKETESMAASMIEQDVNVQYTAVVLCSCYAGLGRVLLKTGDNQHAQLYFQNLYGITQKMLSVEVFKEVTLWDKHRLHALSCQFLSDIYVKAKNLQEAMRIGTEFKNFVNELDQLYSGHPEIRMRMVMAKFTMGDVYRLTGDDERSMECYVKAREVAAPLAAEYKGIFEYQTALPAALENMGHWYATHKQFDLAIKVYEEQYALIMKLYNEDPQDLTRSFDFIVSAKNIGDVYTQTKQLAKAELFLKEANETASKLVKNFPTFINYKYLQAHVYISLFNLYTAGMQHDSTIYYCMKARDVFKELIADDPNNDEYNELYTYYGSVFNELLIKHKRI